MPRPQRIEYAGARYHVLSRGDRKEDIVFSDEDRKLFMRTLEEGATRAGWQVHAFCLMRNHFHLVIETPQPTLVKGMQWMLGTYTARFNARHQLRGHLFSGRYKAVIVDDAADGYLRRLCDYTHLNPARAFLVPPESRLESYVWSSYPMYLSSPRKRPGWLRTDRLLGEHGIQRDSASGRREFACGMETRRAEEDPEMRQIMLRGWRLGGEDFLDRLRDYVSDPPNENHLSAPATEVMERRAQKMIVDELRRLRISSGDLSSMRKGDPIKVGIAEKIHRETSMSLRWIASALQMGTWRYVAFLLYRKRSMTS